MERAKLGPDHPRTLTALHNRALGYSYDWKLDLALPLLEETLALRAGAHTRPKVARGLVKLLVDRMLFDEPSEGISEARAVAFREAARVLRSLPADATVEAYESRLARHFYTSEEIAGFRRHWDDGPPSSPPSPSPAVGEGVDR